MNNNNMKIKEMALLYANLKENLNLLSRKLTNEKMKPEKYYLLPSEWLDKYKNSNDYESVVSHINIYMKKDYSTLKALLEDENTFNSNFNGITIKTCAEPSKAPIINWPIFFSSSSKQNILCPKNFIPVKEEIIDNYTSLTFNFNNQNLFLYDIIIGEQNIFVFDNKNKLNIFICIYDKKQKLYNSISLISFINEIGLKEMLKSVYENNGINIYFGEKKIYINNEQEQDICDNNGTKIGSFINISNLKQSNSNIINNMSKENNASSINNSIKSLKDNQNPEVSHYIVYSVNYPKDNTTIINAQENNACDNENQNFEDNNQFQSKKNLLDEKTYITKVVKNKNNNSKIEIENSSNIKNDINNNNNNNININNINNNFINNNINNHYINNNCNDINNYSNINNYNNNKDKMQLQVVKEASFEDSQVSKFNNMNSQNSQNYIKYPSNLMLQNENQFIKKTNYIFSFVGELYRYFDLNYNNLENNISISDFENNKGYNNNYNNNANFINNNNNQINNFNINCPINDNLNNFNMSCQYNNYRNNNYNIINNDNTNFINNKNNQINDYNINRNDNFNNMNMNFPYNNNGNNNNFNNCQDYNDNYFPYNNQNMNNNNNYNFNINNGQIINNNKNFKSILGISVFEENDNDNNNIHRNKYNNNYLNNQNNNNNTDNINNKFNFNNNNNNFFDYNYNPLNLYKGIKESNFLSDEIFLNLRADKLNKEAKKTVKKNKKLIKIIEEFKKDNDWMNNYQIKNIITNDFQLDMNKTLEEQGIIKDTQINIIF